MESGHLNIATNYTRIQLHAHDATIIIAALTMTKLLIRTAFIAILFVSEKIKLFDFTTILARAQDKPQNDRQRNQNSH